MFNVVEASIAQLRSALESGEITAVDLVNLYIAESIFRIHREH